MSAPHADLSTLRDLEGWHGDPIADAAIRVGEAVYFVPRTDGGIQIEMHAGGIEFEIEVDPNGRVETVYTVLASSETGR